MAIISKGILGGFSGTVGTVIGGNWNGIDYMRSLPTISNKSASQSQIEQRTKFAVGVRFMQALSGAGSGYLQGLRYQNDGVQQGPGAYHEISRQRQLPPVPHRL